MEVSHMFTATIIVDGEQELEFVKKNMTEVFEKSGCALLKVKQLSQSNSYEVEIMFENPSMLYLLGKYVQYDKIGNYDLPI